MMTLQILKFVDFTKAQKSRYFENETFFLQIKKFINCASRATLLQKKIAAEVTFDLFLFLGGSSQKYLKNDFQNYSVTF